MVNYHAAEAYLEFKKLVLIRICQQNVYNTGDTALYGKYHSVNTAVTPESATSAFKDSNAAGTYKQVCSLPVKAGTHTRKGVTMFPFTCTENMWARITRPIFLDWFENYLLHKAMSLYTLHTSRSCQRCQDMLILDNCSAYPDTELPVKQNVFAVYLPPNCSSFICPLDQDVLKIVKSHYTSEILHKMLAECNRGVGDQNFQLPQNVGQG